MSFSYGLHHVFILRLLKHYHFPPTSSLHNLVFLVSAAKLEPQELGVYDFVRTPMGAFSSYLQEVIDDSGAKTPKQLTHTSTQKLFDNKKWYFIGDIPHHSVPKTIVPLRFSWLFH